MDSTAEFKTHVARTAERILQALDSPTPPQKAAPADGADAGPKQDERGHTFENGRTAWELKMELKVPNSVLYLALGLLLQQDRIEIAPHELTYRVRKDVSTVPSER